MKILGWMHRKFRQNTNETQKDFSIGFAGQPSLDDLQCYQKGNYGSKTLSRAPREYCRNSFTNLEVSRVEEEEDEEEEENALTELFHGFLAIGTLGTEQFTTDPSTPTFSITVDDMAEKEKESESQVATENQLKLINHELEKVLGADDEMSIASSGRNSHCSTITLSGDVCPLQNYLFGSAVGNGNGMQQQSAKKQQRTSLGELFHKTKQADEYGNGTKLTQNTNEEKERHNKSMKKLLKKIFIQASDSTPETKLHKIVHNIFNRKVHPENGWQQPDKPKNDYEVKNKNPPCHSHSVYIEGLRPSAEDIIIYPQQQAISKQNKMLPHLTKTSGGTCSTTTGNEFWVKTDADYLVLEL